MKKLIILLSILSFTFSLFAQKAWTDHTRILPDTLRKVPVGITIYHNPNPNYPVLNDSNGEFSGKYVWKHSTFVRSETEDLEVIGAGSFIWYSEQGWFTNVQYDKTEFTEKFNCKDGILRKGKTYIFKRNYRFGDDLYGGDALWFVLARDKNGKIYKGIGLIETEGELEYKK
ncbi:MAG: hypothetical protein U5N85_08080 [Arcicella sp.]|nr:hypothetical protein [Arcicella sp.]